MKVFICYRREDSQHQAGRLYDRLEMEVGAENVFKDVDSIPLGADFRVVLAEAIANCDFVLVLIGDQWIDSQYPDGGRRLDDPDDFVRIEVESALAKRVGVVPVLVGSHRLPGAAQLPKAMRDLVSRHGTSLRPDPFFRSDVTQLIASLKTAMEGRCERETGTQSMPNPQSPPDDVPSGSSGSGEPERDANESESPEMIDVEIDEVDSSIPDEEPPVDGEGGTSSGSGENGLVYHPVFVHEHKSTGFLADLFVTDQEVGKSETILVEFTHKLLQRSRCRVEVRLPESREPLQYLRLPKLIGDYPIVLRVYWLLDSAFHQSLETETPVVVNVTLDDSQPVCQDSVGVMVAGEFKPIIRADVTLPHTTHKRFRTAKDGQRRLSIVPAVRRADRSLEVYDKLKVLVPPAYAGVAWMRFRFRVDPDGRLTVTAHDPTKNYRTVDAWIVGRTN